MAWVAEALCDNWIEKFGFFVPFISGRLLWIVCHQPIKCCCDISLKHSAMGRCI